MTSPDVEKALSNLRNFQPVEWKPDAELTLEDSLKKREEADNLINLASRFVESLDGQLLTELTSRAAWLDGRIGPGTPFSAAWEGVRRLLGNRRGSPKRASDALCPDGDYMFFPLQLTDALANANTWLDEHPEPPANESFRKWRDELWAVSSEADRQCFWGSHLATLCFAATHPQHPQFDLYDYLHRAFQDRVRVTRAIQQAAQDLVPAVGRPTSPRATHSADFRSLAWNGWRFSFTTGQAACVEIMYKAWEQGAPEMAQQRILGNAGLASERLVDVFRQHDAWGTMIVRGETKGAYRLQEPPPSD